MSILISLAYAALKDYKRDENISNDLKYKLDTTIEYFEKEYLLQDEKDWEEVFNNVSLCHDILIALERWNNSNFKDTGLSISRIGDVRSMIGELKMEIKKRKQD